MDLNILIPLAGLIIAIGAGFAAYGSLKNEVANLRRALDDDISRNSEQHREFYRVKDTSIAMEAKMDGMSERLKEVETGIKEILDRLPPRRREAD